jgi:hypothetical protein
VFHKSLLSLAGFALCCPLGVAAAQDFSVPVMITPWDLGTTSTTNIDNMIMQQMQREAAEKASRDASPEAAPVAGWKDTDFAYRYSAARTQQNLRSFISQSSDPAARANLEQMFAGQPTLMDDIAQGVRAYGFDPHNVADAYAVWWINVWGVSQKRNIEPDAVTVQAVKQQVYAAFAATPYLAQTDDATRQQDAEAFLVQAAMLGSAFEQMKNNPEQLDRLAAAARQGAEVHGLDLSKITLTSQGFVPRKGADASGSVAGEDDTIRNARADTPAAEGESSGLGLALAAGAGLGATLLGGFALMRRG